MSASESAGRRISTAALAVELTARCERRCPYCYCDALPPDASAVDELGVEELVPLVLRTLDASGLHRVQLSGGEPLLRPDALEIIRRLREEGVAVSLLTDGGRIDEPIAIELARLGVAPIQLTLLGGRAEHHDPLKGPGSFYRTVEAIVRLVRREVPVSIAFVCTSATGPHFRGLVDLAFALGVRTLAFSRVCRTGAAARSEEPQEPTREQLADCLDTANWANAELGMRVSVAIAVPLCAVDTAQYPHLRFGRCSLSSPRPGYTVGPDGTLRACSVSPVVLGDLKTERFEDIVARARDGYFPERLELPDECLSCEDLPRCGGGCRESAVAAGGMDPLGGKG